MTEEQIKAVLDKAILQQNALAERDRMEGREKSAEAHVNMRCGLVLAKLVIHEAWKKGE